jgi:hypothetical protein
VRVQTGRETKVCDEELRLALNQRLPPTLPPGHVRDPEREQQQADAEHPVADVQ